MLHGILLGGKLAHSYTAGRPWSIGNRVPYRVTVTQKGRNFFASFTPCSVTAVHGTTSLLILRPAFPWADRDRLIGQVVDAAVDGLLA